MFSVVIPIQFLNLSLTLFNYFHRVRTIAATTTAPTASEPALSRPPRRVAGPKVTLATSLILTGMLFRTATTKSPGHSDF